MSSNLIKGGKYFPDNAIDVDFLKANEHLESHGPRHTPVSHALILDKFRNICENRGLMLFNEKGALSKCGEKYMYVADVVPEIGDKDEYHLSVGFRSFNDESSVFQMSCGATVVLKDSYERIQTSVIIPSKRKHQASIFELLDSKIEAGLERFNHDAKITEENIAFMKTIPYSDELLGKLIVALGRTKMIGNTNIMKILEYVDESASNDNSAWKIMNACATVTSKRMANPILAMNTSKIMHDELMKIIKRDYIRLGDINVENEIA